MKLGSLFDGSGGFPLAGALNGVKSVWCSEIEPYPIAVTRSRFPNMKHYGDVSKVNGTNIEPVDIITFGSPCQDLSIAGKREGIEDGARSSLFFQAVRIIKEMREETNGAYPRFAVWENVPGAFSSNKGNDFRLVLEALANVSDPEISIPMPEKWQRAGEIVGNGWSIAWRTLDAQYWGVPQRRKRIYLVADFASESAGEVLFKPDSLLGYPSQSQGAGQGATADAEESVGRGVLFEPMSALEENWAESSVKNAPRAGASKSSHAVCFRQDQSVCYALQGNGIDRADTAGCNGAGWREGECYTLNTIDRPAVAYSVDCRNMNLTKEHGTLQAKENGGQSLNYMGAVCYAFDRYNGEQTGDVTQTLAGMERACNAPHICYPINTMVATRCNADDGRTTFGVGDDGDPKQRKYIVRRLTPTECARLQGFPDAWGELAPYDGDDAFWRGVYKTACEIKGSKCPPKKDLRKWYAGLRTDSAEYKMWGNGIALPCAEFVIRSIVFYASIK